MELEMKRKGNLLVLKVTGELDHHCADELRRRIDREILRTLVKDVVFDFTELTFMDSAGIGVLMGRYRTVSHLGGTTWFLTEGKTSYFKHVMKILEMAGVFNYIHKCKSLKECGV